MLASFLRQKILVSNVAAFGQVSSVSQRTNRYNQSEIPVSKSLKKRRVIFSCVLSFSRPLPLSLSSSRQPYELLRIEPTLPCARSNIAGSDLTSPTVRRFLHPVQWQPGDVHGQTVGKCNGARTRVWMLSRTAECIVCSQLGRQVGRQRLRKKIRKSEREETEGRESAQSGQARGRASAGLAKRHSVKLTAIIQI